MREPLDIPHILCDQLAEDMPEYAKAEFDSSPNKQKVARPAGLLSDSRYVEFYAFF